ncbi:MAG: insulinase family protein [Methylocystis sp.]|nr:insulinase family protein [Methylocystis sp.]MCA3582285.1 insulinase family protein [Methylocystis sp.]MCA3588180.1 insulinase family protein [Methylocystis sp.]MCA3590098.1 insulinase family protein [Methylocystis sp.]
MITLRTAGQQQASTGSRIQRVISPGGVEAWLIEEKAVPLIAMELSFEGGAAQDPAGKSGLSHFLSGMFDEGAGPYDAIAFQEAADEQAIVLRFSQSRDAITASLKTLTRHRGKAFELLRLALAEPRFDADAVERVRAQIMGGIKRGANDPNTQSGKAWFARAFENHPYANPEPGLAEGVGAVTADDLRAFHGRLIARSNLKISVVGAIDAATLAAELDQLFGQLPASAALTPVPAAAPLGMGELQVIDLDIPQSTLRFGMPGLLRKDEDFIPASVMNHILGGGSFTSRIWQEVREKRGLAYSVNSGLYPFRRAGVFYGGTATKNERAGEALTVIRGEIARMGSDGPTEEELDKAKRYLIGSYALRFDTSTKIASHLTSMQVDDLGIDYTDKRNSLFEAVTLEDARRAARRLLLPGQMLVTVAGKPQGL